jgi:hypothetical protein
MAEMDAGRVAYGDHRGPELPRTDNMDRIRLRAHEIWEQEGRPEGRSHEHWLRAEREILGDQNQPTEE